MVGASSHIVGSEQIRLISLRVGRTSFQPWGCARPLSEIGLHFYPNGLDNRPRCLMALGADNKTVFDFWIYVMTLAPNMAEATRPEFAPPSSSVRWLFLGISGALLALLLISGVLAVRYVAKMHAQELAVTGALAERAQMLSGLWLSVQSYNQAVQQFVAEAQKDRDQASRQHLDQLTLEIDSDLKSCPVERDSTEAALLDELLDAFAQQRTLYISVLASPSDARRKAENALADQISPLQKKSLDWSGRLQAWNGERLKNADQALVTEFAGVQGGLTSGLSLRHRYHAGMRREGSEYFQRKGLAAF